MCLMIALVFVLVFLISIVLSFARAEEPAASGTRVETLYLKADADSSIKHKQSLC
jgi:hypothetical protein